MPLPEANLYDMEPRMISTSSSINLQTAEERRKEQPRGVDTPFVNFHSLPIPPMPTTFVTSLKSRKDNRVRRNVSEPTTPSANREFPHADKKMLDTRIPDPFSGKPAPSPPPIPTDGSTPAAGNPTWPGWETPINGYTIAAPLPQPAKDYEGICYFQCMHADAFHLLPLLNPARLWCDWCHHRGYGYTDPYDDDYLPWDPARLHGAGWEEHVQQLSWDGQGWDRIPTRPVIEQVITADAHGIWGGRVVETVEVPIETVVVYQPVAPKTFTVEEPMGPEETVTELVASETVTLEEVVGPTTVWRTSDAGTVVVYQPVWETLTEEVMVTLTSA